MASPQTANGYIKIANELFDIYINISRFLSPYENAVWLCIVRKTYGFNQKEDWISLSQVENMTGIRQPHVARTKKKLLLKNMIEKRNGGIGIQKDYDKWNIPKQVYIPKQALPKQVITITQTGNSLLPKQVDTKDTITKDTITKERYGNFVTLTPSEYNNLVARLGEYVAKEYIERLDNYIGAKGKKYKSHYHTILMWTNKDKPKKGSITI